MVRRDVPVKRMDTRAPRRTTAEGEDNGGAPVERVRRVPRAKTGPNPKRHSAALDRKMVIGWSVDVHLLDWDTPVIRAKVDTGARTSALHVDNLTILPNGQACFDVVVGREQPFERIQVCTPVVKWGRVRSSTGHYTHRCFVKTRVRIGPVEKEIELSLVSRERMQYRMLLGRTALARDFLVDVSHRYRAAPRPSGVEGKGKGAP